MKNRNLPFGLFSLVLSLSFLFLATLSYAGAFSPGTGSDENAGSKSPDRLYKIRCNQVTGQPDLQAMANAMNEVQKMTSASKGTGLNLDWISMGPNNAAGRTRGLIFDNRDATGQTIYAGGVTGGIWKSTNLGLTWHQMNTGNNEVLRITSLVQTSAGVIYAGTGESYCDQGQFIGNGLFRSDDGINFQLIPGTAPTINDPTSDWSYILKLAINTTTGRLFAATGTGLKYSDDGNTWTTIKSGYAIDVKVGSDGTVLAAVNDSAFIAVNGDISNFRNMSTGGTGLPNVNVGWIELAIAPSNPDIMYAVQADVNVSDMLGVWRSEDKGQNWSVVFPFNNTYFPLNKNGCYAMTLVVFPDNPNKVLLGGDDLWVGTQYLPTGYFDWQQMSYGFLPDLIPLYVPYSHHNYVFRPNDPNQFAIATDKGVSIGTFSGGLLTFQLNVKNYVVSQINNIAINTKKGYVMGGGVNIGTQLIGTDHPNDPRNGSEIWIDGGGGNDGGTGGFCEWSLISPTAVYLSQVGHTAEPHRRSEDFGITPSPTFYGTIAFPSVDVLPTHLWESFNFEQTHDSLKFIARDSAIVAGTVLNVKSNNAKFPFTYTVPVTIPKGDSIMIPDPIQSRFFMLANDGIYMTKEVLNFGKDPEWFLVSSIPNTDPVVNLAMTDNLDVLWATTSNGKLYRISNLINAYDSLTANATSTGCVVVTDVFTGTELPFLTDRYVTSMAIDPNNANNVLVTLGNYGNSEYVYFSNNALAASPTFHSVQGNLPAMPVYSSLIEMNGSNKAIIGTDFGVFTTQDITVSSPVWDADQAGIGNVPVMMIKQQTNRGLDYYPMYNWGVLYIATYGAGIYMDTTYYTPLGINPVTAQGVPSGELGIMPNPSSGSTTVTFELGSQAHPVLNMIDLTGRTVLTRDLGNQAAGKHSFVLDLTGFQGGTYILHMNWGTGNAYGKVVKIR